MKRELWHRFFAIMAGMACGLAVWCAGNRNANTTTIIIAYQLVTSMIAGGLIAYGVYRLRDWISAIKKAQIRLTFYCPDLHAKY